MVVTVINIKFNKNGSFDIKFKEFEIKDCYPGINSRPIRPLSFEIIDNNSICYILETGMIKLKFVENSVTKEIKNYDDANYCIETELINFKHKPHSVFPIFKAEIQDPEGIFIQNLGLRGEYGYFDYKMLKEKPKRHESIGITAVSYKTENIVISVLDHSEFTNIYYFEPDYQCGKSNLSVGFKLENTRNGSFALPAIYFCSGMSMDEGLKKIAEQTALKMSARKTFTEPTKIWSSWYYRFNYFSNEVLENYLEEFSQMDPPPDLEYIQIDAGYCTSPGDWLDFNNNWPDGLEEGFDLIKRYGYKPGIWIAPFIVGNNSKLYKNNPEWVLHNLDGDPVIEKKFYEWNKPWNSFDTEYYILDSSHPDALDYIINVFRTLKNFGAMFFKTDFMLWSMIDSSTIKRYKDGKTSVEYFREFLKQIREVIGEESYLLGCIAPFLPFLSYADGMRIGGDVVSFWSSSHVKMLSSKFVGASYFNNIYWQNDPDVVIIRNFDSDLSYNEIEAFSLFQSFLGGVFSISDPVFLLNEKAKKLFEFIKPTKIINPKFPFFANIRNDIVVCYSDKNKHAILICNFTDFAITQKYSLNEIIAIDSAYIYEAINKTEFEGKRAEIYFEMRPRSCILLYCDEINPVYDCPTKLI